MKPIVAHHRRRRFRLLEVSIHHVIAENHHFADGIHVARHIAHLRIHHADFHAQDRPSGHGLMTQTVGFILVIDGALLARRSRHRRRFGQAISRHAFAEEGFLHPLDQLGRGRRSTHMDGLQAGIIVLAQLGRVEQRVGHGRHNRHAGRLLLLDQPEHRSRLETPHHHLLDPHQRRSLRTTPTVGVEQRDGMQLHSTVIAIEGRGDRKRV